MVTKYAKIANQINLFWLQSKRCMQTGFLEKERIDRRRNDIRRKRIEDFIGQTESILKIGLNKDGSRISHNSGTRILI